MKILLISPAIDGQTRMAKGLLTPPLNLYFLKGLTPIEHEVKIVEEEIESLDLDEDCDLVGITCMTCTAPRTYELAKEFKSRSKTVVLGGIHPTIMPDEAKKYASSIIIGEAENIWETLLKDFQEGKLKKVYSGSNPDLRKFVPLDYKKLRRGFLKPLPLITSRGCPYACDFCSIKELYGQKIRHVPIDNIVRYIKESKTKAVCFQDDNIVGDPDYAAQLFKALIPLKIKWTSQASISIADDLEILDLAVKSGCVGLYIGLESVCESQLQNLKKQYGRIKQVEDALRIIRKSGIPFVVSVIFGFDTDTKEIFKKTLNFLMKNKIGAASFMILTPYPNIKLFNDFAQNNRLLTKDWKYYTHNIVVFKPKNMSAYELQLGTTEMRNKFYTYRSIFKRLMGNLRHPLIFLAVNLTLKKDAEIQKLNGNKLNLSFLKD